MRRLLAVVGAMVSAGTAFGETFTWVGGGGNNLWTNQVNWEDSSGNPGVPGSGDRAEIGGDTHLAVIEGTDSITVETVDVNGEIYIEAGGSLTLTNHDCGLVPNCGNLHSIVDGEIELEGGATLAITTEDHFITGDGHIVAYTENGFFGVEGGQIDIASGITLTNQLDHWDAGVFEFGGIRGGITLTGAGTICNDGNIEAFDDEFGVVDRTWFYIDEDLIVEDTSDGRWIVNCESRMIFNQSACLAGDFEDVGSLAPSPGGAFEFRGEGNMVLTTGTYDRSGCGGLLFPNGEAIFGFGTQVSNTCDVDTTTASQNCDEGITPTVDHTLPPGICTAG